MKRKGLLKLVVGSSLVAVLAISIPMVSGCTSPAPEEVKPIKVGIATGLTGGLAEDGTHHVQTLEMARDEINATGGLLGRQIELVVVDCGNDTPDELSAARDRLKSADVDVVNSNWWLSSIATNYMLEVGVLNLHHGWVSTDWEAWWNVRDEYPYFMCLNQGEAGYGAPFFQALNNPEMITWEYPNKKAAILQTDFEYSIRQANWWREVAEEAGWEIIFQETHAMGAIEFGPQMMRIREEEPAIILMSSVMTPEIIALFADFLEEPTNSLFCITYGIERPEFREAFGEQANGVLGSIPCFSFHASEYTGQNPNYITHYETGKQVIEEYLEKFGGGRPPGQTPIAYDSFWIWAEAVERVGDVRDFDGIMQAMIDYPYIGATGTYAFDSETHACYYGADAIPCMYYQVQDEELINLAVGEGSNVELIDDFEIPWWIEE